MALPKRRAKEHCLKVLLLSGREQFMTDPKVTQQAVS